MLRPGDLIFVRGKGLFSYLIRQAAGGHWNHVEIVVSDTESIGAMEGEGVRRHNFVEGFKAEEWQACRVETATGQQANAVAKEAMAMLGGKYDTRAILGIWLKFILKRFGIRLAANNPTQERTKFFCSELVGILYGRQGCQFTATAAALLAPSEIYESKIVAELPVTNRSTQP